MPKLITQRAKKPRKTPPCGRLIKYLDPHSPFQKLVESRRREMDLSGRELARELSRACEHKVSQSTLWIWLHNENGYPHPKSFKAEHLAALARLLKIEQPDLQSALDASRHLYTPREDPMPQESRDALRTLIDILDRDTRDRVTVSYVRNLARNLYNGAATAAGLPPLDPPRPARLRAPRAVDPVAKPAKPARRH